LSFRALDGASANTTRRRLPSYAASAAYASPPLFPAPAIAATAPSPRAYRSISRAIASPAARISATSPTRATAAASIARICAAVTALMPTAR
jgi:hypothetical protein